jgi:hypothetical protein
VALKQDIRNYVEERLPREEDKELFRDLLEAYYEGGPEEVKETIKSQISNLAGA